MRMVREVYATSGFYSGCKFRGYVRETKSLLGRPRWYGAVELNFVGWETYWVGWKRKTKERAFKDVSDKLDTIEWHDPEPKEYV